MDVKPVAASSTKANKLKNTERKRDGPKGRHSPPNSPATVEGSEWKRGVLGYAAGEQNESDRPRRKKAQDRQKCRS